MKKDISDHKSIIHLLQTVLSSMSHTKRNIQIQLAQVLQWHKIHVSNISTLSSFCCFTWQLGLKDVWKFYKLDRILI